MADTAFYQAIKDSFVSESKFSELLPKISKKPAVLTGLNTLGKSLLLASIVTELKKPVIFITSKEQDANKLKEILTRIWNIEVNVYPQLRADTFNRQHYVEGFTTRLKILENLTNYRPSINVFTGNHLIEQLTIPTEGIFLKLGTIISPTELVSELVGLGYEKQTKVFQAGEVASRGEIIDVFPIGAIDPFRIIFNGNKVEAIHVFDAVAAERKNSVDLLKIAALKNQTLAQTLAEFLHDHDGNLVTVMDQADSLLQSLYEMFVASENESLVSLDKILEKLPILKLEGLEAEEKSIQWDFYDPPVYASQIDKLTSEIKRYLDEGWQVGICTDKAKSIEQILLEADLPTTGPVSILEGCNGLGAISKSGKLLLLTDEQIFSMVRDAQIKTNTKHQRVFMADIARGDYIVHNDHGIGQLIDIQKITLGGIEREYLILEYAKGDKLYVPIDQIDKISKYISVDGRPPTLNRLSSQSWKKVVTKIKKESHKFAKELLDLYATRQLKQGISFNADDLYQEALSDSFEYQATPDQETVIAEIVADMQKEKPMDRLLVADVGFGKTEVAMRAAFQAVSSGYQVAVLAPTTILVEQHGQTFAERLQSFNTRVASLSRFKSKSEQEDIVQKVKLGEIDIVIGTHRLLSKDIKFKNLGLVIIDEEQRFGVGHKEKLKMLRAEVDVLSLTATPIPRTLNLALSGIRDISVIETPPTNRLAIVTNVAPISNQTIQEAVEKEIKRGGQVYFVHNRVQTIDSVQHKLQQLLPEIKFIHAHGQMSEKLLAKIMQEFNQHKYDVLIASTIIENGIDNPNVNTLIVDDAGHFGLSQLHQLRGRIGRGKIQGYAYFLYNKGKLSPKALERLKTIQENADLGSGYNIAMRDMQIRGAGGVLSKSQHGHITAIGLSLYTKLLNKAIEEMRSGHKVDISDITIDLPISAFLPVKYVDVESQRLKIYQKLGVIENTEELEEEFKSIIENYGAIPPEVINLKKLLELKIAAAKTQIIASIVGKNLNPAQMAPDYLITISFNQAINPKLIEPILRKGIELQVGEKDIKMRHKYLGDNWVEGLKDLIISLQT